MRIRTKKTLLRTATAALIMAAAALVFLPAAVSSAQPAQNLWATPFAPAQISSISAR